MPDNAVTDPYEQELERLRQELAAGQARSAELGVQANTPQKPSWNDVIRQAIVTLTPAIFGTALGGKEGALSGLQAGYLQGNEFVSAVKAKQDKLLAQTGEEKKLQDLENKGLQSQALQLTGKVLDKESQLALKALDKDKYTPEAAGLLTRVADPRYVLTENDQRIIEQNPEIAAKLASSISAGTSRARFLAKEKGEDPISAEEYLLLNKYEAGEATPEEAASVISNPTLMQELKRRTGDYRDISKEKVNLANKQQGLRERALQVTGYEGSANNAEDAKLFRATAAQYENALYSVQDLEESLKEKGQALTGDEFVRQATTIGELLKFQKERFQAGAALTETEKELMTVVLPEILASPTSSYLDILSNAGLGRDPLVVTRMFKNIIDRNLSIIAQKTGFTGRENYATEAGARVFSGKPDWALVDLSTPQAQEQTLRPRSSFSSPKEYDAYLDSIIGGG